MSTVLEYEFYISYSVIFSVALKGQYLTGKQNVEIDLSKDIRRQSDLVP